MTQNYESIHNIPTDENLSPRNYAKAKEKMNDVTKNLYYGTESNFFKAFQGLGGPAPRVATAINEIPKRETVKLITFTEKIYSPKSTVLGALKLKAPMTLKLTNLKKNLEDMDKVLGLPATTRNSDTHRFISKEEIDREERNAELMFNFVVSPPKRSISKDKLLTIESQKIIRTELTPDSPERLYYPLSRLETPSNHVNEKIFLDRPRMKMRNVQRLKTQLDKILLEGIKTEDSGLLSNRESKKNFSITKYSTKSTKSLKTTMSDTQKPIQISKWSHLSKN